MLERIKKVIGEVTEDPASIKNLSDDADMINDVGLDSLQMIDFMLRVEEEFGIELDFDSLDFSDMTSIRKFGDYLALQIECKKSPVK